MYRCLSVRCGLSTSYRKNPPSQGQALNRSIRNRAAKPGVLQQLRAREGGTKGGVRVP